MKKSVLFWILLLYSLKSVAGISVADSLQQAINRAPQDSSRYKLMMELAGEILESDPDACLKLCISSYAFAEQIKFDEGIGESLGWIAYLYEQKGDIRQAIEYYNRCLTFAIKTGSKSTEAAVYNNLAAIFKDQGKIDSSLAYHQKSININTALKDEAGLSTSYNNIGLIYFNQGKIEKALEYYNKALTLQIKLGDKDGIATAYGNFAGIYKDQKDFTKAEEYYLKALKIQNEANDKYGKGYTYNGLGVLKEEMQQPDSAMHYYSLAKEIRSSIGDKTGLAYTLKNIGTLQLRRHKPREALSNFLESIKLFQETEDKWGLAAVTNKTGRAYYELNDLKKAEEQLQRSLSLATSLGYPADIGNAAENLQLLYRSQGKWKEALQMNDLFVRMRDSVLNDNNKKAAIRTQFKHEYDLKEAVLKSEQEKKDAVANAEITRQKLIKNGFIAGSIILALFIGIVIRQRNNVRREKNRSEALLLNILPEETAEELKNKGSAEARQYDQVTVMFTDFSNFTSLSEKLSPQELVNLIHRCYSTFDQITEKYNIEKIKTIGDSYMCAAGLPSPDSQHGISIAHAAIEIRDFMLAEKTRLQQHGAGFPDIRIGIHSGTVVAGIVGIKKFAYDIWGDTVNIASRMESSGEAGKINISETTYQLIHNNFNCTARGMVEAKNKGTIQMYFLDEKKS